MATRKCYQTYVKAAILDGGVTFRDCRYGNPIIYRVYR